MQRLLNSLCLCLCLCLALPAAAQDFITYKGHGGPIMALDVSPEGRLASASFDNSVGLWPGPEWLEGHDAAVTALNYEAAPALLSGGDDFRVLLWHSQRNDPVELTKLKGKISAIAIGADPVRIAVASWDGTIRLLHIVDLSGTDVPDSLALEIFDLLDHRSNVTDVAFSPDGTLYSSSSDGTLRVWEGTDSQLTARVIANHGFGINRIVVHDDWIAYGAVDGATRVIDPETGAQLADFTLDRRPILSMEHHPQTGQLAIGDGEGHIMIVDTNTWLITRDFRAMREGPVWALAFSTDGTVIHAGGIEDVIFAWPVALLDTYDPAGGGRRSFLRDVATMDNGERQFMRKCSICHSLKAGPSRKAGPTLHRLFGRRAGVVPGYRYSPTLDGSAIIWTDTTIDTLFDKGPDHYIPGSKMPMQVIAGERDRADLIAFLRRATRED
ncbi:c-type cytochrome [Ruegeria sp. 2012CJ41-6]|uniref:C-type cytochrome n=1 Tax=Ruegeria spongiae TaxID=2942209 RepID=A0ABT0Q0A7_9RHOB|nr:c-type cytochrome [Ruegeria spongiae]MCL6282628.1 c-type cytochrome [Ruegeria spongiae]